MKKRAPSSAIRSGVTTGSGTAAAGGGGATAGRVGSTCANILGTAVAVALAGRFGVGLGAGVAVPVAGTAGIVGDAGARGALGATGLVASAVSAELPKALAPLVLCGAAPPLPKTTVAVGPGVVRVPASGCAPVRGGCATVVGPALAAAGAVVGSGALVGCGAAVAAVAGNGALVGCGTAVAGTAVARLVAAPTAMSAARVGVGGGINATEVGGATCTLKAAGGGAEADLAPPNVKSRSTPISETNTKVAMAAAIPTSAMPKAGLAGLSSGLTSTGSTNVRGSLGAGACFRSETVHRSASSDFWHRVHPARCLSSWERSNAGSALST